MLKYKKKIIILKHNKGRLCNQLWNFISVYAYCLERGYQCQNYSFSNYAKYFDIPLNNKLIDYLFFTGFNKNILYIKLRPYYRYMQVIKKLFPQQIIYSGRGNPFYLPPSTNTSHQQIKIIKKIEKSKYKTLYFDGWLFRNPVGIKKFHQEIVKYFKPKQYIVNKVDKFLSPFKRQFNHIVGVHIRQQDYQTFENGKYFFSQKEVKNILDDYLNFHKKNKDNTLFILCSDGQIDKSIFNGLNIRIGLGGIVEDLYILSSTDLIIGSNSTYGAYAAYYGNMPFIVFERGKTDWDYYLDKNCYFENKHSTIVNY